MKWEDKEGANNMDESIQREVGKSEDVFVCERAKKDALLAAKVLLLLFVFC